MKNRLFTKMALVHIGFVLGLIVGLSPACQLVRPSTSSTKASGKFQYKYVRGATGEGFLLPAQPILDQHAEQGWELVTYSGGEFVFKK